MTLFFLITAPLALQLSTVRTWNDVAVASRARTSPITAYLSEDDRILWSKTSGGMSFKDIEAPATTDAVAPRPNDVVAIAYRASIMGGAKFEEVRPNRPLRFALPSAEASEVADLPFIFIEAIGGMKVGGKRRLLVPPSSRYAMPDAKETIEFEVELVEVQTGPAATFYKLGGFRTLFRLALLLSFVPDVAHFLDTTPLLNGDEVTSTVDAAVALAGANSETVDVANRWAVDGLARLGL